MALIVGIDLGRKSAHDVVILKRETGLEIGRGFRFSSSPEGFNKLFRKIEAVRNDREPVDFVIDSPGRAWIPVAAVLKATGFRVYRPSAYRVKKTREAGHRRNKTNRIDALTLARCLRNYPKDTAQVFLPQGDHARLDQIVRQRDRVVDSLARRKQRIQDLCEAVNPGLTKLPDGFLLNEAGRAFLRAYTDPRTALRLGKKRLGLFLQKRYRIELESETLDKLFLACENAVELYQPARDADSMPFDERILQDELNWELDQLEREEQRRHLLELHIKKLNRKIDPTDSLISLPGIRHILAAGIRTCVGDIDRFESLNKHKGFAGFYPSVSKTGDHASSPMPMSKMSCNRYKRCLYLAAENAYKWDLEMAAFYHKRRRAGHTHTQAVCAVANAKLLPRIHQLMKSLKYAERNGTRRPHYVFRDLSGNPISKTEAKAMITATWGGVDYSKKGLATA
ncbi:MAG: IS110 family transposase [Candidatus Eisenbacteria bacterium]|nr:IS110 family transposase [Candidatus Eisenbacteria bacterium]